MLKDLLFAIAYLYDIIIYSKSVKEHLDHLQQVFHKLCNAKLNREVEQVSFFAKEIQYFGHILSNTGTKPLPSKTPAIKLMNPLKTAKQVRTFLGLAGY